MLLTSRNKVKIGDFGISKVLDMTLVTSPVLNFHEKYGWCAFVHWIESGMHCYTWKNRSPNFFSVDIYTCKPFSPNDAENYTKEFFGDNLLELVWRE